MPQIPSDLITPEIYAPTASGGSWYPIRPYPTFASSVEVVADFCTSLKNDLTAYGLGLLLGMPDPKTPYQWVSGKSRPCPYYLNLMLKLNILAHQGVDFRLVRAVDWEKGVLISYEEYNGRPLQRISAGQRERSERATAAGDPLSRFLAEPPR